MDRGKMPSAGRGAKSKAPQHPQDIFALGSKSTVVVNRDSEKRNIHKPSSSGVERKREATSFGTQTAPKRPRIGSPAEAVSGTSLEIDPVDLVPNVLQALDTHNSDKLLGLLTGSIRLLKSQRAKPDPILCMSMLYLTKIRPNMIAHETVTQTLCTLLKREQGAAFKNKGNPLVFVLACNMLYAGHKDNSIWPDIFIRVYIDDALNERCWVDCSWCKCFVENIVTAFNTKQPPPYLIPSDNTLGTMSPSGSGSPLMGSNEDDTDNTDIEYSVFPRYSSSYETVEGLVLEAIKEQIQRRAAPDTINRGFLKLLSATCGFPEIRMISASRLEAWLHSGKLWRAAQELLARVCCNAGAAGPRDHEVLAQLARMRLKTKPLQLAYQACLREMVSESPALLRSVVTHTIYNELSNVRSPNNMAVLASLISAQAQQVPAAMAETFIELLWRAEDYLRPLRALVRECARASRAELGALLPFARALAARPAHDPPNEIRERAFSSLADLFCCCCLVTATLSKHVSEPRQLLAALQAAALGWLLDTAPLYRPSRHDYQLALHKIMFVESAEVYSKPDNWPPECERALAHRICCESPLTQHNLLRLIFIGLSKEIPVAPAEALELLEQVVRRACALPPEDNPLTVDKLEVAEYIFQLCQFNPPDNITLPAGYTPPPLAITGLYWRGWTLLLMLAAHNPPFAERAAAAYPTLRALIETCITNKPSIEWGTNPAAEAERAEAERAAILQLESHLAAASNAKLPVTEHTSRLLSQLTGLEPGGAARRPGAGVAEGVAALGGALRLGRLLCRAPALLLALVERHGTRRAMPWLHQLLRHDHLQLSVLPVQCLAEFLAAGAGAADKAGQLCAHLRRTLCACAEGARAVLHYYLQRLAHPHTATRAHASRGLKLVLTKTEDTTEMDYNADVSPEEWLDLLWDLEHWEAVREEVVCRIRAACLVECVPRHLAAYVAFLARHVLTPPGAAAPRPLPAGTPSAPPAVPPPASPEALASLSALVLDLSQVLMERGYVLSSVMPPPELRDPPPTPKPLQHRTLHAFTTVLYTHLMQIRYMEDNEAEEAVPEGCEGMEGVEGGEGGSWPAREKMTIQWANGRKATLDVVVAQAHLKLLCYGPSILDAEQAVYSWLTGVWVGGAPGAAVGGADALLPDWLRLHMTRSARPLLLAVALQGLSAQKMALFIQTFGMPVPSMTAMLRALDACPAGAVERLNVERPYITQLLRVQRIRGVSGGEAFAAALQLEPSCPPDVDLLFVEEEQPLEKDDAWEEVVEVSEVKVPPPSLVPNLLAAVFENANTFQGGVDIAFTHLIVAVTAEAKAFARNGPTAPYPYLDAVVGYFSRASLGGAAAGVAARGTRAAALLRALLPAKGPILSEIADKLLVQYKCLSGPMVVALRALGSSQGSAPQGSAPQASAPELPPTPTREQLLAVLENATPSTLEAIGHQMIETCSTELVVDVISQILENNQSGQYEIKLKNEDGVLGAGHLFSRSGLGCGLLLDWLAELQQETLGPQPERQMRLMFRGGVAAWRPALVTQLAHRASWRTLRTCLRTLLHHHGEWSASGVVEFCATLSESPRVGPAPHRRVPDPESPLQLQHRQLEVLIGYIITEALEVEATAGADAMRRRMESRLTLVLRAAPHPAALLAAARAARHPLLLLLLYMQVPKIRQLLARSEVCGRGAGDAVEAARGAGGDPPSPSALDPLTHALLTALAATALHKDHSPKLSRLESAVRGVFARGAGAGRRALPLAGALLRGAPLHRLHPLLLAALELLPDLELFHSDEIDGILECYLTVCKQAVGRDSALVHRVAALARRYVACRPQQAAALLHQHRDIIANIPALSSLVCGEVSAPASAAPPPVALRHLQTRLAPPDELLMHLQEVESWGQRRGGAWGGAEAARAVCRAVAPLAAHPHPPLRTAALALLTRLLPAVPDPTAGIEALLECLESRAAGVCSSALERVGEACAGSAGGARRLLRAATAPSAHPALARAVAALNLHRGC